ncbi:MAG: signal peptidase I [Lachnospiraceae bacterium]|nr:signal peptidase I [Lachnospiraceae bacterium]
MIFEKKNKEVKPVRLEKQPSLLRDILTTLLHLGLMVGFVIFFLTCIGQRVEVEGSSMEDTLHNKDQLIVDCFTYRFLHAPKRQDIVVFRLSDQPDTFYVKRIIGLPGETVQIKDSVIYINGKAIEDPYATQRVFPSGSAEHSITLGENEFFVMGDNRNNSKDSRYSEVGPVSRSQIVGRAWLRVWPFDTRTNLIPKGE